MQNETKMNSPVDLPWMRGPFDAELADTVLLGAAPVELATNERACWVDTVNSDFQRARRQLRARRSRCAFTGRFKREWEPVTEGPQWAFDLDAELTPPAHKWCARSNARYWGGAA